MAPDCRSLLGAGQIVFEDPIHHPTLEGPKIYRKDGWYYIFAPAGSVHGGWQTVMRSRQITGPYEARIVLEQGATPINGPHQGALIDTPSGQWWFLHFQSLAPYGRIVHLQPVAWHDGWPVIGQDRTGTGIGEPVLTHPRPDLPPAPLAVIPTSDDFRSPRLGLQWQWQANHQPHWYSLTARPGSLRLFTQPAPVGKPEQIGNLVAQKFHALSFRVVTAIEDHDFTPTDRAGLALTGGQPAGLFLARDGQGRRVELVIDGGIKGSLPVGDGLVYLRFDIHEGGHVRFWLRCGNGPWQGIFVVAHALMGNWVGAKFGLTAITAGGAATSAYADVRGFVVGTLNDDPDSLAAHIPKT
jgi:beta-xylosidase